MQVKIMEDDTIEETIITIRCRKKDEKIKRHISNFCEMSFLVKMILCNLDFHRFPRN